MVLEAKFNINLIETNIKLENQKIKVTETGNFGRIQESKLEEYKSNVSELENQLEAVNQDLVKAYEEEAKVANTALYLVLGMMVTFSGVGFVLFKIWKKKRKTLQMRYVIKASEMPLCKSLFFVKVYFNVENLMSTERVHDSLKGRCSRNYYWR